jgi:hypothetical protein
VKVRIALLILLASTKRDHLQGDTLLIPSAVTTRRYSIVKGKVFPLQAQWGPEGG